MNLGFKIKFMIILFQTNILSNDETVRRNVTHAEKEFWMSSS